LDAGRQPHDQKAKSKDPNEDRADEGADDGTIAAKQTFPASRLAREQENGSALGRFAHKPTRESERGGAFLFESPAIHLKTRLWR
jgi:hypothetical protein